MIMPRLCPLWRGTVPATHLPLTPGAVQQYCLWKCCPSNWTIAVREFSINFVFLQFAMQTNARASSIQNIAMNIALFVFPQMNIYIVYMCSCTNPLSNRFHRLHEDYALYLICCQSSTIAANSIWKVCNENLSAKADSGTYSKNKGCVQPWDRARPAAAQVETSIYFLYFFQLSFNKYISMMNSVDAVKISTARIFYCSHFSINLITRRFVIIGAWKNKFNFFSLHQATLPKLAAP